MSLVLQSLLPYPHSCQGTSPHQQGWDTKMLSLCGIDVSKDRLDVIVLPEEQRSSVSNNRAGWADLVERLRGCSIAASGLEASGGFDGGGEWRLRAWRHACVARGRPARAPGQSVQTSTVCEGERGSGEERSARCPNDRIVRRHHADTSSAAADAGSRTAGRDARCSPPAQ